MVLTRLTSILFAAALIGCGPREEKGTPKPSTPALSLTLAADPAAGAQLAGPVGGGYPRFADHHSGVIVFSAEGDLWQVSAAGGLARRLTTHIGNEFFARFSRDGKHLAFSGDYDGNQDVFVMPAIGGSPRRLTYHPAEDQVLGWTPDGRVLFRSRRDHPHGDWTLYSVAPEGGDAQRLPLARAARLAYEPDGDRVAINIVDQDFRNWKRYAGGTTPQIFVGDLKGGAFRKLTTFRGANGHPMWYGGRIYFLSDRTGTQNIWSMTPEGTDLKQHTRFDDYDVRYPGLGQGKIVFQHRAELHLLDLASGQTRQVPLNLVSDAQMARTRFTVPARYLTAMQLTPDGRRLGLEIRGDLHVIPAAKEGRRIQVSQTPGARERGISFSDDSKELATTSDATGETEVYILDAQGSKPPRQVTSGGQRHKLPPSWAPGGKLLAYADSDNRLLLVKAKGGASVEIDRSPYGHITRYSWSPDGRWLAYARTEENYRSSIYLYDTEKKTKTRVTDELFDNDEPTWSADGKYLGFLSDRTLDPHLDQLDVETIVEQATKPYLVLLSAKTRSPFLPASDDEAKKDKDKDKDKDKEKKSEHEKKKPAKVEIDVEGIEQRVVEVPVPAGRLSALFLGDGFVTYLSHPVLGMASWEKATFSGDLPGSTLMRFAVKDKKVEKWAEEVVSYSVSRDSKKLVLLKKKGKLYAVEMGQAAPKPEELTKGELPLKAIREQIDPTAEWRQIFHEVWRMMRDYYWSPDLGKIDWEAVGKKYALLLPRVATRDELEDLMGEMVAELSLGHTYLWGGDKPYVEPVPVGLLGADLEPHASGLYRFARVYDGENWDPDRQSPLTQPYSRVREGEVLLQIDGRPIRAGEDVYSRLQKAAGELVQLTVAADPKGSKKHNVEITTLRSERAVRYLSWAKKNREHVARRTDGKVGYFHLPDMMTAGLVEFDRWYYPQIRKQGLIIDARWNRGGFVSQMLIKRLTRRVLSWSTARSGWVGTYPENTLHGKIVVLTNERAGSDGDIFPRAVQVAKIGPVIGTRTWGGVVGINLSHPLVDKGISTRPGYFAWFDLARRWDVEGTGVDPDIVVDNDPGQEYRGIDAQLERGITEVLELLRRDPPLKPALDDRPDKTKKSWVNRHGQTDRP
jgi:tricorn protease